MHEEVLAERPQGLRARKLARTREQILLVAMAAFRQNGYEATTLEEIADAADVHRRTLLRYFPSKAHLVLDRQYSALAHFRAAVEQADGQPIFDIWSEHVLTNARKLSGKGAQTDFLRIAASEPALRQAFLDIQERYRETIGAELEKQFEPGFNSRIKARVVADALVTGNYSVASMVIVEDNDHDRLEAAEREVLRLVRDGLMKA